jgi:hypothetical protein
MQQFIVIVLVTAAALVSAWKLMPARRRLRALLALDAWLTEHAWMPRWRQRVLAKRIQKAAGSGCAGCAANVGTPPRRPR